MEVTPRRGFQIFYDLQRHHVSNTLGFLTAEAKDLAQQEIDFSVVFAFPNFLNTERPIYVAPSFGLNLLQGAGSVAFQIRCIAGVLELQWQTDPQERFNVDLGLGIGVHSDFKTLTGDSIRLTGHALFNLESTKTRRSVAVLCITIVSI